MAKYDEFDFTKFTDLPDGFEVIDGELVNTNIKPGDKFNCLLCKQASFIGVGCSLTRAVCTNGNVIYGYTCKQCYDKFVAIYEEGDSDGT